MLIIQGVLLLGLLILVAPLPGLSLEKLKLGSLRGQASYYLPPLAAEEKGFWKEQGLEVEYVTFRTGRDQDLGILAGAIHMTVTRAASGIIRAAAGIPTIIVADLAGFMDWYLWVRETSAIRQSKDLEGTKIGVIRLGDIPHPYVQVLVKALGLRGVKVVATGGITESLAALRSGVVDAIPMSPLVMTRMEIEGLARKVANLSDHLPKEWDPVVLKVRRDLITGEPATTKKIVLAVLKACTFIMDNPGWAMEKMKKESGYPDLVARRIQKLIVYSTDGKIYPDRLKKISDFLLEHGLVSKGKIPPLDEMYTNRFVSQ